MVCRKLVVEKIEVWESMTDNILTNMRHPFETLPLLRDLYWYIRNTGHGLGRHFV